MTDETKPLTECIKCEHYDDDRSAVRHDAQCPASPRPLAVEFTSGKILPYVVTRDEGILFGVRSFDLCREINQGYCFLFAEMTKEELL